MRDFYAASSPVPLDQADGLRRMFAGQRRHLLALAANPHVPFAGVLLDRVAQCFAAGEREVLVVDAADGAPDPHELARLDLAAGIERIGERVSYLPARGLPLAHVDTRGSATGFIDALHAAAPGTEVFVVHAEGSDLARMLMRRAARPVLVGADHPESIKHAYAMAKLLARRTGLATFDLLLAAAAHSPRADAIAASLGNCIENFLGGLLHDWTILDPADAALDEPGLSRLLAAQLALDGLRLTDLARAPSAAGAAQAAAPHAFR
jgi:flagellar biosynthesis protein FlhG